MVLNFTRHRRHALEAMTRYSKFGANATSGPQRDLLLAHMDWLSHPDSASFILPDNGEILSFDSPATVRMDSLHLPFQSITLEYSASPDWATSPTHALATVISLFQDENDGWISGTCSWLFDDAQIGPVWGASLGYGFLLKKDAVIQISADGTVRCEMYRQIKHRARPDSFPMPPGDFIDELRVVAHFLLLTNCSNVKPVKLTSPSPTIVRRANQRGKLPPDEYWILDCLLNERIEGPAKAHSGSHAPPRFHVRRGHVRHLPTGRMTWVRQCTVGDASLGTVRKDYRVVA